METMRVVLHITLSASELVDLLNRDERRSPPCLLETEGARFAHDAREIVLVVRPYGDKGEPFGTRVKPSFFECPTCHARYEECAHKSSFKPCCLAALTAQYPMIGEVR